MAGRGREPGNSVFDEPHMRPRTERDGDREEAQLFAVWDEPTLGAHLSPEQRPQSFRHWWQARAERLPGVARLASLLFISVVAGPVAVVTVIIETISKGQWLAIGAVGVVFLAPTIEEIAKTLLVALAVEAKPYLFRNRAEVLFCALASALSFAAIENLVYLGAAASPTRMLVLYRWIVCTSVHLAATALTGWGLASEWHRAWQEGRRPEPGRAFRWLVAAIIVHAAYNGLVLLASIAKEL